MGLLDLPAPLFNWMDGALFGAAGPLARLALWAVFISGLSMAIYSLLSPQAELKRVKADLRAARRELRAYDGDFEGIRAIAARTIGLSLRHLRLVAPAALIACIPVIMLIVWLARAYGPVRTDSGLPLKIELSGGTARLEIRDSGSDPASPPVLVVSGPDGRTVINMPLSPVFTRLEKRRSWHWLSGNPAGYLPKDAPVESVRISWPRLEVHALGPAWLRGWEVPFLAFAVLFSLGIQAAFRIE